jgi:hypothetical protein
VWTKCFYSDFLQNKKWPSITKKHVDCEHANVANMYFKGLSQKHYASQELFAKQCSKIWKIVILSFILQFFGNTSSYKKR